MNWNGILKTSEDKMINILIEYNKIQYTKIGFWFTILCTGSKISLKFLYI